MMSCCCFIPYMSQLFIHVSSCSNRNKLLYIFLMGEGFKILSSNASLKKHLSHLGCSNYSSPSAVSLHSTSIY
jgi:hypothetical protein